MIDKTVKRYPLSKQVADKLELMIENSEYTIGEKIHTETELMDIFGVSRNTLREAIQSLVSVGILEVKQGDGTYVKSNNRFNASMSVKYTKTSIADIKETREFLEATISYLAAQRRTEKDVECIFNALFQRKKLSGEEKENTLADMEFHFAIADACNNEILIDLYKSISKHLESHIYERQQETMMDNIQIDLLHENLYLAIKNQERDNAAQCARDILNI